MTEEKKLSEEELEKAQGAASYNLSAKKAPNRGELETGEKSKALEGGVGIEPNPVPGDREY